MTSTRTRMAVLRAISPALSSPAEPSCDSMALTKKEAWAIVGGLGNPSKMPGKSYGISALKCKVGSALRKVPGSVCSGCYALKGQYRFSEVVNAHAKRLASISDPRWVEAMTVLCRTQKWFRWHDSGDLQSPSHLEKICEIAERCPQTRLWLPTREKVFVYTVLKRRSSFPKNLTVRVSGAMIDGPPPVGFPNTSSVVSFNATCPAPMQGNQCGDCRRCWDRRVKNVSYTFH